MECVCHENRRGTSLEEGRKRIFLTPNYPDSTTFNWHPPVRSFKVPFQFSIVKHLLHLRCTPHHPDSCMSHLHRHSQPERRITPASSLWAHFSLLTQSFIHSHACPSSVLMSPVCYCTAANNIENGLPLGTYIGRMHKWLLSFVGDIFIFDNGSSSLWPYFCLIPFYLPPKPTFPTNPSPASIPSLYVWPTEFN